MLALRDRVVVDRVYKGTIRYIGRVGTRKGVMYGVELDIPAGDNNGSKAGKQYFICASRRGVFRPADSLKKYVADNYNRSGIITVEEPEEVPGEYQKDLQPSEGPGESSRLQGLLEELRKENSTLMLALQEEKKRARILEAKLQVCMKREENRPQTPPVKFPTETSCLCHMSQSVRRDPLSHKNAPTNMRPSHMGIFPGEGHARDTSSARTPFDIILDIFREVRVKIDVENAVFSKPIDHSTRM